MVVVPPARVTRDAAPDAAQAGVLGRPVRHPRSHHTDNRPGKEEHPEPSLVRGRGHRRFRLDQVQRRDGKQARNNQEDDLRPKKDIADACRGICAAPSRDPLAVARRNDQSAPDQHKQQTYNHG